LFSVVRFARKEKEKKYRKKDTFRSPESGTGTPRTPSFVIKKKSKNERTPQVRKLSSERMVLVSLSSALYPFEKGRHVS
jgi:hypothetical protein